MWKYLRIAVTAISLLVCVLLIGLWVRSYFRNETLRGPIGNSLTIRGMSFDGIADFMVARRWQNVYHWRHIVIEDRHLHRVHPDQKWFYYTESPDNPYRNTFLSVRAPYWFLVIITATIATLPWIKWHFSLRTLLIVMTLFALFFGAIAMSL